MALVRKHYCDMKQHPELVASPEKIIEALGYTLSVSDPSLNRISTPDNQLGVSRILSPRMTDIMSKLTRKSRMVHVFQHPGAFTGYQAFNRGFNMPEDVLIDLLIMLITSYMPLGATQRSALQKRSSMEEEPCIMMHKSSLCNKPTPRDCHENQDRGMRR